LTGYTDNNLKYFTLIKGANKWANKTW
jgi:hypothetical protein